MLKLFGRRLDARRNRREARAQVRWGLEYIQDRYGPDAALTMWRTSEGRDWYAGNAPQVVHHCRFDGLTREDVAAQVRHSTAHAKRRRA